MSNKILYCLSACVSLLMISSLQSVDPQPPQTTTPMDTVQQQAQPGAKAPNVQAVVQAQTSATPPTQAEQPQVQAAAIQPVIPPITAQNAPVQSTPSSLAQQTTSAPQQPQAIPVQPAPQTSPISTQPTQVIPVVQPMPPTAAPSTSAQPGMQHAAEPVSPVPTPTPETKKPTETAAPSGAQAEPPSKAPEAPKTEQAAQSTAPGITNAAPVVPVAPAQGMTVVVPPPTVEVISEPEILETKQPIEQPVGNGELINEEQPLSHEIQATDQEITTAEPSPTRQPGSADAESAKFSSNRRLRGGDYFPKPVTIIPAPPQKQGQPIVKEELNDLGEGKTEHEKISSNYAYLGRFLKPWELLNRDKLVEINFENAQLMNLIQYFEKEYGLTFILDNVIEPMTEGGKSPVGIRFSFKTEKPLNKKQAWDLFISFLDMAGLMLIPGPDERVYQITSNNPNSKFAASKEPIPTFINIDQALLPTSDIKIRYVYFIQNTTVDTVKSVVEKLRSPISSQPILISELNALILTDKASNIQTILTILKELDKPILPETLTILKLKKTEAEKVQKLYENLVNEEKNLFPRLAPWARKQSVGYFTENVRVIADKRTNSLIILGPRQNVKKIEDFIIKEIDREIDLPYSPLHVYPLKFIDAAATAQIINDLKQGFQSASTASQLGGLIGGTRFIKPTVTITAEKLNNSLIINADYDDYLQIYELLEKIDVEQPQVAIRILVLDVTLTDNLKFGMQFRTPVPYLGNGTNVNFQNSGLPINDTTSSSLVQNFNSTTNQASLLGDLINLVVSQEPGSTILTLPADSFGIYGILKTLQTITNVSVVAKPFLVTTHKYNASVNIAQTRRVITANIIGGIGTPGQSSQGDLSAGIVINVSPQISPDDYVTLTVSVEDSQFTPGTSSTSTDYGNRNVKKVTSNVILGDNQVLALGGIIIDQETELIYKVPLLGDIPLLGWFFKNKTKAITKTSSLILISAQIVRPQATELINGFTKQRLDAAKGVLERMDNDDQGRDPIHRWFFDDHDEKFQKTMNTILSIDETDKQFQEKTVASAKEFKKHATADNQVIVPEKITVEPKSAVEKPQPPLSLPNDPEKKDEYTLEEKADSTTAPQENDKELSQETATSTFTPLVEQPQSTTTVRTPEPQTDAQKTTPPPAAQSQNRRRLRNYIPTSGGDNAS